MGLQSQLSSKAELHRREKVKRFDEFFRSYFAALDVVSPSENMNEKCANERRVTLLARGPESAAAEAVQRHAEQLCTHGCELQVIFAQVEPADSFARFGEAIGVCTGSSCLDNAVKWAKNPALLDAHEQLVLGSTHCWSGDAMSRSSDVRFALDLFESDGGNAVELGQMAFEGMWSASAAISKSRFRNVTPERGEPVIVHFDGLRDSFLENALTGNLTTRH